MRRSISPISVCFVIVAGLCLVSVATAQPLPGLSVEGETWKLERDGKVTQGIVLKPEGEGPFPAIIISHGLGGNARGFAMPKAKELAKRGFVCIATDYTHSDGRGGDRQTFGASEENVRRGRVCVEVLRSLPYVNAQRVYAYGNSMGAFLTIALAAEMPQQITAAAITAGGISDRPGFPAPTPETAAKIKAPFLILHGTTDTTVRPEQSAALEKVLAEHKVVHKRQLFEGVAHNLHQQKSAEVLDAIVAWFNQHTGNK
jgi:dipeptidyl aminopeptidase/acylaminoacyl peptidase